MALAAKLLLQLGQETRMVASCPSVIEKAKRKSSLDNGEITFFPDTPKDTVAGIKDFKVQLIAAQVEKNSSIGFHRDHGPRIFLKVYRRSRVLSEVVYCLMSTLGFADALSQDGVKYLAASPETMLAPGTPTSVAEDIAKHIDDPAAMAKAVVRDTMHTTYGFPGTDDAYKPAAAMDVLDLDPAKIAAMRGAVKTLDGALTAAVSRDDATKSAVLDDARSVDGMVRFDHGKLPWHADRPAIALYDTFASDPRLPNDIRTAAGDASKAVGDLVLAHSESHGFAPFDGADYRDAVGPTVHFATTPGQVDPWYPKMSETHTAFYKEVGAAKLDHALLA